MTLHQVAGHVPIKNEVCKIYEVIFNSVLKLHVNKALWLEPPIQAVRDHLLAHDPPHSTPYVQPTSWCRVTWSRPVMISSWQRERDQLKRPSFNSKTQKKNNNNNLSLTNAYQDISIIDISTIYIPS